MEGGREMQLRVHSFIRKENTPFWREKHLRIPDHLCGWLKLEEEPEVSRNNQEFNHRRAMHVKKRSPGVKTRCKFEQVLNINLNVWSAKGSTAHLQQVCAVLVLCALVQWICAGDIKMKSVQMLNGWSIPGLGPQGKLEGLCVGSFNNCFGKFVPFFNGSGKKLYLYILVLQPALINLSGW